MTVFAVGDRVKMSSGRRWHGTIEALAPSYPAVPVVNVRWDNGLGYEEPQAVNVFMMGLVPEAETPPTTRTEWGVRLDCAANGCDPPHADDGRVLIEDEKPRAAAGWVNSHAAVRVRRTVTYSAWEVAP